MSLRQPHGTLLTHRPCGCKLGALSPRCDEALELQAAAWRALEAGNEREGRRLEALYQRHLGTRD